MSTSSHFREDSDGQPEVSSVVLVRVVEDAFLESSDVIARQR
jgi:hypothetical protein